MSIPPCLIVMDDKRKQDGRDDAKVDLNDPNEVSYVFPFVPYTINRL